MSMRLGDCKHFNGMSFNKCCDAGINYRKLVGGPDFGWAVRLPCLVHNKEKGNKVVSCEKHESVTIEEINKSHEEVEAMMNQFELTLPLIAAMKKKYKGRSAQETVDCPVCKGRLHMSIASVNGHVWGKCETDDCLTWME